MAAPDDLRERLRHLTGARLVEACLRLRTGRRADTETRVRATTLRRLGGRIRSLTEEINSADKDITELTQQHVEPLLAQPGIGPITAAQAWISWSETGRFRSEASFAALAGVCPIPVSSGKNERHRLNRHGDRALNRAIHQVVVCQERSDPRTRDYISRRVSEGKTRREIRRCLKRYTARKIFKILERTLTAAAT
ncbi:transposase [Rugosimonospora africana]|nr:transposase [Rugosimonospora africana]